MNTGIFFDDIVYKSLEMFISFGLKIIDTFSVDIMTTRSSFKFAFTQWQTSRWRLRGLVQTSCLTMANISVETTGPCPNFMSHNGKHLGGDYGALSKLHVSQWQTSRWRLRGLVQTSCLTMANISVGTTGPCPNFMSHNGKHLGGDYGALSKLHVSQWQTSRWRLRGLVQTSCLTMANISVETTGLVQTSCLTMVNISVGTKGLVQTSCLTMANISVETTGPCPNFKSFVLTIFVPLIVSRDSYISQLRHELASRWPDHCLFPMHLSLFLFSHSYFLKLRRSKGWLWLGIRFWGIYPEMPWKNKYTWAP